MTPPPDGPRLSALVIAKDEEQDLPGCLQSISGLAGEVVVVVDDATIDRTEQLARAAGAKVLRRRFDDYARQRQAGLDEASGDWCLWIDADERVTPPLAEEIRANISSQSRFVAFEIPFRVRFLGRTLRWGGLGSERHLRLFRRERARFIGGALHEGLLADGPVGRLSSVMLHEPYRDVSDYMSKLERYTELAARKRLEAGRRTTALRHLRLPGEFLWRAFVKLGVLDGRPGLTWAALSAYHSWLKYQKLAALQNLRKSSET